MLKSSLISRSYILVLLSVWACQSPEQSAEEAYQKQVQEALKSAKPQKKAFLTYNYGATRAEVDSITKDLVSSGRLPRGHFYFTSPPELRDIEWSLSQSFYNDSLTDVSLIYTPFGDTNNLDFYFPYVVEVYEKEYGKPALKDSEEVSFIRGEQGIELIKNEHAIHITYRNLRLQERFLSQAATSVYTDEGFYDQAYYDKYIKPKEAKNPNGI